MPSHKFKRIHYPALALSFLFFSSLASADTVVKWNEISLKSLKKKGLNSNLCTRILAIEAIAVYDAVNTIQRTGTPYRYLGNPNPDASAQSAAAQAAHDVLIHYAPETKSYVDSILNFDIKGFTDGNIEEGRKIGSASAESIIKFREGDGSEKPDESFPGPLHPAAGQWRPTPPNLQPGINKNWRLIKPFQIYKSSQFLPAPPPTLKSRNFQIAESEVLHIGSKKSTVRTDDQTHIAQFYKQDAELTVNEVTRELLSAHTLSLGENALILALVDIAEADARIAVWDSKYYYIYWRPVTALNEEKESQIGIGFEPLLATPPHPSYPSGHSGTVTAGMEILKRFFGDKNEILLHTTTPGEPTRTLHSLSEVESENGLSRIYGGIHFAFDNTVGQEMGRKVAEFIFRTGPHKLNK